MINEREKTRKLFRVQTEIKNNKGEKDAIISASLDIKIMSEKINLNRETLMITYIVKGSEIKAMAMIERKDIELRDYTLSEVKVRQEPMVIQEARQSTSKEINPDASTSSIIETQPYEDPEEEEETSIPRD